MVAHIYREQNAIRSSSATFSHFVEVCGMLTIHDRKKKREGASVIDALCKALGWYFPLMAKFRIRSVEELVFRKFPYVCPYCRRAPHEDGPCKLVKGTKSTVDHDELRRLCLENQGRKPRSLNGWQQMFQEIYPRSTMETGRSTIGLLEELGELAEAIRVYDQHPMYLLGEAADTFSYLMGIANEHQLKEEMNDQTFSLEDEFLQRYPGLCPQCGFMVCVCPSVPDATVGRMAKELDIGSEESLFIVEPASFSEEGKAVALRALDRAGGYSGLASRFPFDRGDANKALVLLCLRLADAVHEAKPDVAETLRRAAIQIGTDATYPGSPKHSFSDATLIEAVREAWRETDEATRQALQGETGLANELGAMIGKVRVLFVGACPREQDVVRVSEECRAIKEAVRLAKNRDMLQITQLDATTADDLRRELLNNAYEIVHLAGHGDPQSFLLHGPNGQSPMSLSSLRELIDRHSTVRCVILNSCHSALSLTEPIGLLTVGMDDSIVDDAAIEFSRGFYDAIGAGKNFEFAVEEGKTAARMKGVEAPPIVVIKATQAARPVPERGLPRPNRPPSYAPTDP
jgi:NTP pyrophosphatase (non-canonical NTP hydrolase)